MSLTLPTTGTVFGRTPTRFSPGVDVAGEGIVGSPGSDGASPYLPGNIVFGARRHADTPTRRHADTPTRFSPGDDVTGKGQREVPVRAKPHPTYAALPKAISTLSDLT
jgi:hypothetical protein